MGRGEYSVVCPIDGHKCTRSECVDYKGTPERPCKTALRGLVNNTVNTARINIALGTYADPTNPSQQEISSSLTVLDHLNKVSNELKIDIDALTIAVLVQASKRLNKQMK